MKNLNKLFDLGTLSGKERCLLLVHDGIAKQKTGKGILSETEIEVIRDFSLIKTKGPDGRINYEKRNRARHEFNNYIEAINSIEEMKVQLKLICFDFQNRIGKIWRIVDYAVWKSDPDLEPLQNDENIRDAVLDFTLDNTGMNYLDLTCLYNEEDQIIIENLVNNNQLEAKIIKEKYSVITGASIYLLKENYDFRDKYLQGIKEIKPFISLVLFIKSRKLIDTYAEILKYKEFLDELSKIYEIELDFDIKEFINELEIDLNQINLEMSLIYTKFIINIEKLLIPFEVLLDEEIFDTKNTKPKESEIYLKYEKKIKNYLDLDIV